MTENNMKKILIIFIASFLMMACKKEPVAELVVVSVYSLPVKNANYNEPQTNYYHIVQIDDECWVVVRTWVISDFVENKFKKQDFPKELYNSTFETRFEIPKYLIK